MLALGNGFTGSPAAHRVVLDGAPTIGVIFFEESLDAEAIKRGKQLSLVITGSTWNERVLRAYGFENVRTILQGVDPTQFHRAPKLGVMRDRFLIFSGGKAELRKGQDITMAAFKIFAKRHPDATLVTAWHSPWPHLARSLDQTGLAAPVAFDKDGKVDVRGWAAANEIAADQIIDLGDVPNSRCRTSCARWTSPYSRTGPRAAPTWSPWSAWPAASRSSCRAIPGIST